MSNDNRPVMIFGLGSFAQIVRHGLEVQCGREVAGFTVDGAYLKAEEHGGLPVVAFERLTERFAPERYDIILPLGHHGMHALRRDRFERALAMGYRVTNYISPRATVLSDVSASRNLIIHEGAIVQPFVSIGDDVTLRSGVIVGHDSTLGAHCSLASGVVTGGAVNIGEQAWVGLGAVVNRLVRIAERSFIGAGAVVVADTEPDGVYIGVPAKRMPGRSALDVAGDD